MSKRERYEEFLVAQTDTHLKNMSAAMTDRLVRGHIKRIKEEYSQYHWSETTLRDFAWLRLRHEIASELNLPRFEQTSSKPNSNCSERRVLYVEVRSPKCSKKLTLYVEVR